MFLFALAPTVCQHLFPQVYGGSYVIAAVRGDGCCVITAARGDCNVMTAGECNDLSHNLLRGVER